MMNTVIGKDIDLAAKHLINGNLVAIPTETVYGLAANAFSAENVVKIFEAKNRPFFDPLIIHTYSLAKVLEWIPVIDSRLLQLAEAFWPGPLTLLLPKPDFIPDIVTSGLERVAIRVPNHSLTLSLLSHLDFPLAAPSANPFGYVSPTTAQHVYEQLNQKLAYILDGGDAQIGVESTIVGLENDKITIYRKGGLTVEEIQSLLPNEEIVIKSHSSSQPAAPGMLESHYSPNKKVYLGIDVLNELKDFDKNKIGILVFNEFYNDIPHKNQIKLSENGDINEAAKNLFSSLRAFDKLDIEILIIKDLLPENGLGIAVNDRLKRAAAKG
ncbi:MAG: hypothetical protein RLZZ175_1869 [Bacteroidota bacterium]